MKKKLLLFLFALPFVCGCSNSVLDEEAFETPSSRSVEAPSFFKDVTGENTPDIYGYLYCSQVTTYDIIFTFEGDPGMSYQATIGDKLITSTNGASFRKFSVTLQPGKHYCNVTVWSANPNLRGVARLNIQDIRVGEVSCTTGEGYSDLVAAKY